MCLLCRVINPLHSLVQYTLPLHLSAHFLLHLLQSDVHGELLCILLCLPIPLANPFFTASHCPVSASSLCSLSTSTNICLCPMVFLTSSDSFGYHTARLNLSAHFSLHLRRPGVHGELQRNRLCSLIHLRTHSSLTPIPHQILDWRQ